MNVLKDFLVNFLVLALVFSVPFILFPNLLDNLNQMGIGLLAVGLLFVLLIFLAIPSKGSRDRS
jgi:hypothetical protein